MALPDLEALGPALIAWVVLASLATFAAMVWDKRQARRGGGRVRESTLVAMALIGGGPGGLLAAYLARHKTRNLRVLVALWLATIAWLALLAWVTQPAILAVGALDAGVATRCSPA